MQCTAEVLKKFSNLALPRPCSLAWLKPRTFNASTSVRIRAGVLIQGNKMKLLKALKRRGPKSAEPPKSNLRSIYRDPAEESINIYRGLVVHDGRVTGSITIGRSRLPIWAIVPDLVHEGWNEITDSYLEGKEYDAAELASFLVDLLNARGEFGRLLLTLAEAERQEQERVDRELEPHGPVVRISLQEGDGGVELPSAWYEDEELRKPVREQLLRCLKALDHA